MFISDNLQKHRFITSYTPKVIIPAIKVNRSNVFRETLDLYTNIPNLVHQLPLKVSFRGEKAVDTGGVGRECFSCFWEEAYKEAFDGASLLTLAVHYSKNLATSQTCLHLIIYLQVTLCAVIAIDRDSYRQY